MVPSSVSGSVAAPASKSHLQRAIAIAALAEGESQIVGYESSADVNAAVHVASSLGAKVVVSGAVLSITGAKKLAPSAVLHCGEAGLCARMFSPIASLSDEKMTLSGEGSLLSRPFGMVQEALSQLGKSVTLTNGSLPMELHGKMRAGDVTIDGSESSQLLTGLLIALPLLTEDSVIHVRNLKSKPYVEMTLDMLAAFGITVQNDGFKKFLVRGNQRPKATEIHVEGDWSGAAFLLVAGAVGGDVTVTGLNPSSAQADRAILDVLADVGAEVSVSANQVTVKQRHLHPFSFDATDCPDLFPPLAALAASCEGVSTIIGTERLAHKESDRASTISEVLQQLGIRVELSDNAMRIWGGTVYGGEVSSHNDHRIAMMATVLGCSATGPVIIHDAEAVNKSYPKFFHDMASLTDDRR